MTFGYDPELPDGYQEADLEMAQATETANEIASIQRASKGGKDIDAEARSGLKWLADNTDPYGGSLTAAMTQWLSDGGYDTSTDEAQDAIFKAMFA